MTDAELKSIPAVYAALQDEESRGIYKRRLLYSLTGDDDEIMQIIADRLPARNEKICLYGAGEVGQWMLRAGYRVPFVIDQHRTGTVEGCPILSLNDFLKLPDCRDYLILVAVVRVPACDEIASELARLGLDFLMAGAGHGEAYFDLPQLNLGADYFVDAGAMDGATTVAFFQHCPDGHAYVFEPNLQQRELVRERLKNYDAVETYPYGLSSADGTVRFETRKYGWSGAKSSTTGDTVATMRSLDGVVYGGGVFRPITLIKMDIEGSELAALKGAERTIREQRPKLAICVYHKTENIWEIPALLLSYNPAYRLYLRHYSLVRYETVLYALP